VELSAKAFHELAEPGEFGRFAGMAAGGVGVVGYTDSRDKHACCARREELRDRLVVEREAGRAVAKRERGEREPPGRDGGQRAA